MHVASRVTTELVRRGAVLFVLVAVLAGCTTGEVMRPTAASAIVPLSSEKYASIVIDAASGRVLYERNSRELRHPASLTKMMTLYMLFEAIDDGRVSKQSPIPVSAYAAARPPTKIGFRRGESIDVNAAILALCVRSANDVAVAVAEALGGSEERFAEMMTSRARQIGMSATTFRNASGLHDPAQVTTARDIALLSIALRKRFPHHYHYFGNRDFTYAGRLIRGHNDLIGRVQGVNGLKTGYIRASGFNLATSVDRGGRRIVAVVMGGESARSRNAHMEELIEAHMPGGRARILTAGAPASAASASELPGVGSSE